MSQFQGAQKISSINIQGQAGYLVVGANWRSQFLSDETQAKPNLPPGLPPGREMPLAPAQSGVVTAGKMVSPAKNLVFQTTISPKSQFRPPLVFGRIGPAGFFGDFVRNNGSKQTHALVWQQDNILSLVDTTGEPNDEVSGLVAGSLFTEK